MPAVIIFLLVALSQVLPLDLPRHYPPQTKETMRKAGLNWRQFKALLDHYEALGDEQKLLAAHYLIAGMDNHGYVRYSLYDNNGFALEFEALRYPDHKSAKEALDALEKTHGETEFKKSSFTSDLHGITADYLIDNIDLAFKAWRERPWAKDLPLEDFLAYVLPYRGTNEPLGRWRTYFMERYRDLPRRMKDPSDPGEAAALINRDLRSLVSFDELLYFHPTDQGFQDMLGSRRGRCEDLSNMALYAMRANAIPVALDYTPHWPDRGNNHMWNALIQPGGASVAFMGALDNPGEYGLSRRMAKAYRTTYAVRQDSPDFSRGPDEDIPGWLAGRHYMDVTPQYTDAHNILVTVERDIPATSRHLYLSVFNAGRWKAVAIAAINKDKALFTDVGGDIAYLPMFFSGGELLPAGPPFILDGKGGMRPLDTDENGKASIRIFSTVPQDRNREGGVSLDKQKEYELLYWKDKWVSAGKLKPGEGPLEFYDVPSGGLYLALAEGQKDTARIFTVTDGIQEWW